jgi:adenylylsulfate kinase
MKSSNIVWQGSIVSRTDREMLNKHRGAVIWLTGLSGSGKSTLAYTVEKKLHQRGCRTYVLDGDNIRHGLCSDLSFSRAERSENIRRVGEVAKLFVDSGAIVLAAFISPFENDRAFVRALFSPDDYLEVYCACSLDTCEARDLKGLYQRARNGEISDFTGISSPFEIPLAPSLHVDTQTLSVEECITQILDLLSIRAIVGK